MTGSSCRINVLNTFVVTVSVISARCRTVSLPSLRGAAYGPTSTGEKMKYLFITAVIASTFAGLSAASAAGGCGIGFHRGPYGGCRPNGVVVVGPRVVARPVVVVPRARICPLGFVWAYGRCRVI